MDRSRIAWATSAFAPWALGFGLLVSLAAHADPDPETGGLTTPARVARLSANFPSDARLIEARYVVGDRDDLGALPDEIEPRFARKTFANPAPVVNRAHRGDPFVALRPGFEAKAHARQQDYPADSQSPTAAAEPVRFVFTDGATPAAPLGFALASASPLPADGRLLAAGSKSPAPPAPSGQSFVAANTDLSDRPSYATLIDAKDSVRQMRCLAEALYFEARSEPEAGQAAVAQVVLNRVRSGIYPTTVCGVVYQDRERPFACQFSFACEGKSLRVEEPACWATATRIAEAVVKGETYDPKFASAINYHAAYVRPFWAPTLKRLDRIGLHIFYAMRPGLYWAPGALNGRGDLPPLLAQAGPGPQAAPGPQTR
jgi:spore germination cell wall hydrolase CwlJ-like protein